jgi:hypothetical protein
MGDALTVRIRRSGRGGYVAVLRYQGARLRLPCLTAAAERPDAVRMLERFLNEAALVDRAPTLEMWAQMRYRDVAAHSTRREYRRLSEQTAALHDLLGSDFGTFLRGVPTTGSKVVRIRSRGVALV